MKNSLRYLFGISALALLITAAPVMAAEVDVEATNEQTGANSDNDNVYTIVNDADVTVVNSTSGQDVTNNASASVNTGNNDQTQNTEGGTLRSGSVDASTDWESVVNSGASMMGADAGDLDVKGKFTNDTTGSASDNDNVLGVNNDADFTMTNSAEILNALGLTADTGNNDQDRNTTVGDVRSGDVDVEAKIGNWANNDSGFTGAASGATNVNVTGENKTTGANSDNDNTFNINNSATTTVTNVAEVTNSIGVNANTGHNDQLQNTTAGDVKTGKVEVKTDIKNAVNNGSGMSGAVAGDLDVDGDFANDTTGFGSDNDNMLSVSNDADTSVVNNAEVTNTLSATADTGNNNQINNTTGGDVETGSVSINFGVENEVNSN